MESIIGGGDFIHFQKEKKNPRGQPGKEHLE